MKNCRRFTGALSFVVGLLACACVGWAAEPSTAQDIHCPDGTVIERRADAEGPSAWCHTADGTPHGLQVGWYTVGGRRLEAHWVQGLKHGRSSSWNEEGKPLEEADWVGGQLHGTHTLWYDGGGRRSATDYDHGRRNGRIVLWDEAGVQIVEGRYIDGRKHGVWSFRGPGERASQAALAVMIDGEDMTQGLLESPPTDCESWADEPSLRRSGYLAILSLLSLRAAADDAATGEGADGVTGAAAADSADSVAGAAAADGSDGALSETSEFPVARCIAEKCERMSAHIDRLCTARPDGFVEAIKLVTVDLAVGCSN